MKLSSEEKRKILVMLIIITISILIYHIFNNIDAFVKGAKTLYYSAFSQITMAFFIAFLINIPLRFIEGLFDKYTNLKRGAKRSLSIAGTILLLLIGITIILRFAIPQLVESINRLTQNIDSYIGTVQGWLKEISDNYNYQLPQVVVDKITELMNDLIKFISTGLGTAIEGIYGFVSGTVTSLLSFIVSFTLSIYMLLEKDKIIIVLKKMLYSLFSIKISERILWLANLLNHSFSNFFRGQLTEGLILAILSIVSMQILGFEYAILIGFIVGFTNIIPMFGAFLGGMVGFLILLMVNPIQALWFALFVVVLQQIESNLIYPRVVGGAIGLSGFWIFVAVIVGGGIAGLSGIVIGIPLFTTMQEVLKEYTTKKLYVMKGKLPKDLELDID